MLSGIAFASDNLASLDLVLLRLAMARSDGVRCALRAGIFCSPVRFSPSRFSNKNLQFHIASAEKTSNWEQVLKDVVAPAGATSAQFQFQATSLNAKINIDDCSFAQK